MKRKTDRKRHCTQVIETVAALLATLLLAVAAFCIPGIVYSFNDKDTFAKQEGIHIELTQYEKEGSFLEQLFRFALCSDGSYEMHSVRMEEGNDTFSNEELTQVIQSELDQMSMRDILDGTQIIQTQDLVSRELYTSYIEGWNGQRNGITFWKVKYQNDEEENAYELEIILDMEYHKIYGLKLTNAEIEDQCYEYEKVLQKQSANKYQKNLEEHSWEFICQIYEYYGINEKGIANIDIDAVYDYGVVNKSETSKHKDVVDSDERSKDVSSFSKESEQGAIEIILYQLMGRIIFEEEEEDLFCRKEYGWKEAQSQGYLYVGINRLEQMLQL